jgi:uncharacterized glyoxalase superfamily protein PhnB
MDGVFESRRLPTTPPCSTTQADESLLAGTTSVAASAFSLASVLVLTVILGTQPNPDHIYFAVDNLEEYFRRVSQTECSISRPIQTQPWGERSFYRCDPFGNNLCFVDAATSFTGEQI